MSLTFSENGHVNLCFLHHRHVWSDVPMFQCSGFRLAQQYVIGKKELSCTFLATVRVILWLQDYDYIQCLNWYPVGDGYDTLSHLLHIP